MKAIRIERQGGTDVMQLVDVPLPEPKAGEARVKLAASGVNFLDVYHRSGQYKVELPATLGSEGAGIVDAVGAGVTVVKAGDRVAFSRMLSGSYAEYATLPADALVPVPESVALETAAAVMLQGITAHYLTHSTFKVEAGQQILLHAAAGGVGLLLIQIAKQLGAFVIGTVSTDEKAELAKAAGADAIIRYDQGDFVAETRRLTEGAGVHVVYDSVGKATFNGSLDVLRRRGYLVLFGQSSGAVEPVDPQTLNRKGSLFLTRPTIGDYIATRDELLWRTGDLFAAIAAGTLQVRIDRTLPLADVGAAHTALERRETAGKVVLQI